MRDKLQKKQVCRSDPLKVSEMGGPRYLRKELKIEDRLQVYIKKPIFSPPLQLVKGQLGQCQVGQKTGGLLSAGAGRQDSPHGQWREGHHDLTGTERKFPYRLPESWLQFLGKKAGGIFSGENGHPWREGQWIYMGQSCLQTPL